MKRGHIQNTFEAVFDHRPSCSQCLGFCELGVYFRGSLFWSWGEQIGTAGEIDLERLKGSSSRFGDILILVVFFRGRVRIRSPAYTKVFHPNFVQHEL